MSFPQTSISCNDPTPPMTAPATILVVDDEDSFRELLEITLNRRGYQVRNAADAREGLQLLKDGPCPSVVLLDLHLRTSNCVEAIRLRTLCEARGVAIIAMSGDAASIAGTRSWAATSLLKPFDFQQLLEAIESSVLVGRSGSPA